jgi:hypothetical protein
MIQGDKDNPIAVTDSSDLEAIKRLNYEAS